MSSLAHVQMGSATIVQDEKIVKLYALRHVEAAYVPWNAGKPTMGGSLVQSDATTPIFTGHPGNRMVVGSSLVQGGKGAICPFGRVFASLTRVGNHVTTLDGSHLNVTTIISGL